MDCLENLIGLSQKACDCFDVEDTTSDSGLWLDELEGLNLRMIDAGRYCEELTDFMVRARDKAIKSLRADILTNLKKKYLNRYQPYIGLIGEQQYKKNIVPSSQFVGLEFESRNIKGSRIKIKRIGINISETKTVTINGYKKIGVDDDNNSIIDPEFSFSQNINAIANRWTYQTLTTPLVINLYEDGYECLKYLFGYEPTTETFKDNDVDCGCGLKGKYIETYVKANGVYGTVENYNTESLAHGIVLDVEMVCESEQIICDNLINSDYKLVLAHALQYKAGFFLVQDILTSPNGDTYTNVVNPEQLFANAKGYEEEYQNRVKFWIPDNMVMINNDCYMCGGAKRGKILS